MKSAKCPQCGFVGWADAEVCKRCSAAMSPNPDALPAQSQESYPPAPDYSHSYAENRSGFQPPLKQGLATAALVIGILNFLFLGIFGVTIIAGIVISVVALKKIKRHPFQYGGKSMAVAGLVINIVSVVVLIPVLVILGIAIPNLLASRRAANEGSAIKSLRTIYSAQATYQSTHGDGTFGSLDDLQKQNLISPELASGMRHGYRFQVTATTDFDGEPGFVAIAVPTEYGSTGRRSFYLDERGVFRGGDLHGGQPNRYDAPLNIINDASPDQSTARRSRSESSE